MKMAFVVWEMAEGDVKYKCHKAQEEGKRMGEKRVNFSKPTRPGKSSTA